MAERNLSKWEKFERGIFYVFLFCVYIAYCWFFVSSIFFK